MRAPGLGAAVLLLAGCPFRPEPPAAPSPAPYAAEALAREAAARPASARPAIFSRLVDVTADSGLGGYRHETGAFGRRYLPEPMGPGLALADIDGDGRLDLAVVQGKAFPAARDRSGALVAAPPTATAGAPRGFRLFRGLGGFRFEDATAGSGLEDLDAYGMGVAAADLDGDGRRDLVVTALDGLRVLRGEAAPGGRARFAPAFHDPGAGWLTSIALLDFDRDGRLDVFACGYVRWSPEVDLFATLDGRSKVFSGPRGYAAARSRLYRNAGALRLEDASAPAGIARSAAKALGALACDVDGDGRPDLVVANDTEPNALFLNRGVGRFEEVAIEAGIAYDPAGRARAGMGIDAARARDGRLALSVANFSREPVALFLETRPGSQVFTDRAGPLGVARPTLLTLGFGLRFLDLDLDGREDLVVANGHLEPEIARIEPDVAFAQPLQVLRACADGRFEIVPPEAGGEVLGRPLVARALASADLDGDGDDDLVLSQNGGGLVLLRNDAPEGARGLRVRLRGAAASNRDAIGAEVALVLAGGARLRREVRASGSYLAQSEPAAVFGLAPGEAPAALEVRWPAGAVERFGVPDVPAGVGAALLVEGAGAR